MIQLIKCEGCDGKGSFLDRFGTPGVLKPQIKCRQCDGFGKLVEISRDKVVANTSISDFIAKINALNDQFHEDEAFDPA